MKTADATCGGIEHHMPHNTQLTNDPIRYCESPLCGDALREEWTVHLTLDIVANHRFCCLEHAKNWIDLMVSNPRLDGWW